MRISVIGILFLVQFIDHCVCLVLPSGASFSSTKKPLILLDVDGVINMIGRNDPHLLWPDSKTKKDVTCNNCLYNIVYSPEMISRINAWNIEGEVQWLTTWNNDARIRLAPALGLNDFPVARNPTTLSKPETFRKHAKNDPNRAIIWIDDELLGWKRRVKEEDADDEHKLKYFRKNSAYVSPVRGLLPEQCAFVDEVLKDPTLLKDKCVDKFEEWK